MKKVTSARNRPVIRDREPEMERLRITLSLLAVVLAIIKVVVALITHASQLQLAVRCRSP